MEAWYEDLSADSTAAYWCFTNDYGPFADLLATFCGTVLDLGGGNGVTRHYLRPDVRYVVVDPSFDWLGPGWAPMAESFPCLATPPPFVRGIGEQLPFRAGAFDAVLAFWSLNHVSDPERVFEEVRRVLRDGGRFLAVLEDMEPRWRDLLRPPFREHHARGVAAAFAVKLEAWLPGGAWPLQDDHLLIRERDLAAWSAARFEVVQRAWVGRYLTYEFRRRPSERP
jgi:SAM-dependent methyltransferase